MQKALFSSMKIFFLAYQVTSIVQSAKCAKFVLERKNIPLRIEKIDIFIRTALRQIFCFCDDSFLAARQSWINPLHTPSHHS